MLTTSPPPPWAAMGRAMSIQFAPLPLFILKWSAGWSAFSQRRLELGLRLSDDASGRTIWIADAHGDDGKRFVVRAEEKPEYSESVPKERQPPSRSHGATSTYWLQCLTRVIYQAFSCTPHHRIVPYDNDFTVKWRRGFGRKKRS